jgi:hypothetical protein
MDPHQNIGDPHLLQQITRLYNILEDTPARVNTAEAGASNTVALGASAEGGTDEGYSRGREA